MKIVSPFELVILQACDPEEAKKYRAETSEEKATRLHNKIIDFANKIKIKK